MSRGLTPRLATRAASYSLTALIGVLALAALAPTTSGSGSIAVVGKRSGR